MGLSPRTRGRHRDDVRAVEIVGSIPANAGETATAWTAATRRGVYPRERGGDPSRNRPSRHLPGLSPRTRGRRSGPPASGSPSGSIPANAGETSWALLQPPRHRVYPRERGGDGYVFRAGVCWHGLSPRTRGRLDRRYRGGVRFGSIPANAGETSRRRVRRPDVGVYPRERGGDLMFRDNLGLMRGLSPRTRGRLANVLDSDSAHGSIPANAGETRAAPGARPVPRVYPRERGGDRLDMATFASYPGLSPRTRGRHRPTR